MLLHFNSLPTRHLHYLLQSLPTKLRGNSYIVPLPDHAGRSNELRVGDVSGDVAVDGGEDGGHVGEVGGRVVGWCLPHLIIHQPHHRVLRLTEHLLYLQVFVREARDTGE